jgi:uncharacterized protein YutE (UPF0331/DUF86 family)
MAKFRNVIVHLYDQNGAEIVVSILRKIDDPWPALWKTLRGA